MWIFLSWIVLLAVVMTSREFGVIPKPLRMPIRATAVVSSTLLVAFEAARLDQPEWSGILVAVWIASVYVICKAIEGS